MKRNIDHYLFEWKSSPNKKPLLLRGARQIGKSYSIRQFGQKHYDDFVEVNFEFNPELISIFEQLDPFEIIKKLNLALGVRITPGRTLLFLDEIQDCPRAIQALRYFYEKIPQIDVIGAGSLLEFTLSSEDFRSPVGRIQFLHMYPLSFTEFLDASGDSQLVDYLNTITLHDPIDDIVYHKATQRLREYFLVGGLPSVVNQFLQDRLGILFQREQSALLQTFRNDFGKYARKSKNVHLVKVFNSAPRLVGQHFKYVHVDRETPSRDLREATQLLSKAGLVYPIYPTSGAGLPLQAQCRDHPFKLLFVDIGLMQRACGMDAQIAMTQDLMAINTGALAEQFVGQELLASTDPYIDPELYFWKRDQLNSQAEVDYLVSVQGQVLPLEVKSGSTGTLKSLRLFMQEYNCNLGIRLSTHPLSFHDRLLSIPIFVASQLTRLAKEAKSLPD